jgi:hemoglobin
MSDGTDGRGAATLYEVLGGEEAIQAFTQRCYTLMDTLPEAAECWAIHPQDLSGSRQKLFEYLQIQLL